MSPRLSPRMPAFLLNLREIRSFAPQFAPWSAKSLKGRGVVTATAAIATIFTGICRAYWLPAGLAPIAAACFSVFVSSLPFSFLQGPAATHNQPIKHSNP